MVLTGVLIKRNKIKDKNKRKKIKDIKGKEKTPKSFSPCSRQSVTHGLKRKKQTNNIRKRNKTMHSSDNYIYNYLGNLSRVI